MTRLTARQREELRDIETGLELHDPDFARTIGRLRELFAEPPRPALSRRSYWQTMPRGPIPGLPHHDQSLLPGARSARRRWLPLVAVLTAVAALVVLGLAMALRAGTGRGELPTSPRSAYFPWAGTGAPAARPGRAAVRRGGQPVTPVAAH